MKLFDFQEDWINDIGKAFKKNHRVVAQAATGFGKGVVIADLVKRSILKGNRPLIVVHREEIFQQIYGNLKAFGIQAGIITAGRIPMSGHPCYVAMVETLHNRIQSNLFNHLGITFTIIDEAHLGNFSKVVKVMDHKCLLVTATPRSTGAPELKEFTDCLITSIPVAELIRVGRLVPAVTYSVPHDWSKVKKNSRGEFLDKAVFDEFKKPKLWTGACEQYLRHAKGMQALAFSVNVEQSQALCLQLRESGFKAYHLDGKTDEDTRRLVFNLYREGKADIICNVGIATTGTDLPDTRCIIKNFATNSLVKNVQVDGRGARAAPDKNNFIVIDMGRNYLRHGLYGEEVNWQHIYENPASEISKGNRKGKRECPECGAVVKVTLQACPFCNHVLSKERHEKEVFHLATSLAEIKTYKIQTLPVHLRKPLALMTDHELYEYGMHMGYDPKWHHTFRRYRLKKKPEK